MADIAKKRRYYYKRYFRRYKRLTNQMLRVKLSLIDRVSFPEQSGQPRFGLSGNQYLTMDTLVNNSQYTTFATMFGIYKFTGIAIELVGQGTSANFDYPCAIACFPSGLGSLTFQWPTVRAADMNVMLNPNGRVRKYFKLTDNPYRQIDQIPSETFVVVVGSQANATQEALLTFNVKIDLYFRFRQLKI